MEQNQVIVAKKFWKIVRVMYFMLRRGISKGKLLAELNMSMKRAKIAGKLADIHNLMFNHHAATRKMSNTNGISDNDLGFTDQRLVKAAIEMINSTAASPALPSFGPSPKVRQLRVTDSPYPLMETNEVDNHVDEAAEEFIMKFYRNLRQQNSIGHVGYS